jgi:aldehyde dehydrogenase
MAYLPPDQPGAITSFPDRYDNFIGGKWVAPLDGEYFDNLSPVDGKPFVKVARSRAADVDLALDAAHAAAEVWGRTSSTERSNTLLRIADRMEEHLEALAVAETWDNGKPVRETLAADLFHYMSGWTTKMEGATIPLSGVTAPGASFHAYTLREPVGVVGQIIPWNFPLLMAAWKLAPALAAGNAVVLKPASETPASIMKLMEIVGDLIPDGVLNVVNGHGSEAGAPLARSPRIAKIAFTGSTETGRLIMQYATENLIPVTLELGGKSPNVFLPDVMAADDEFLDKAIEGFVMFAFNQGEVCTSPSRALIHESIYGEFMARAQARVEAIVAGDPLDPATMMGAQASRTQLEKILTYIDIGRAEGATVRTGGHRRTIAGLQDGYYVEPTVLEGDNSMRVFQEEIFGPVVSVTRFRDTDHALRIANDTVYGLGAGVWSRDTDTAYRLGRGIKAGRVWVNNYHAYPAHAAFGGYKQSGIGRETHKMMLDHYQQTKNVLVSYSPRPLGFF